MENLTNNQTVYEEHIYAYLSEKYNEKFIIKDMSRQMEFGKADVIMALCESEAFPKQSFYVRYQLPMSDIYMKDEIIKTLKATGKFDESMIRNDIPDTAPVFEDTYNNIRYQNMYTEKYNDIPCTMFKSWFDTPNYYPDETDGKVSLDEYLSSDKYDIYVCSMIFVSEKTVKDKGDYVDRILSYISNNSICEQYVYFYFTDESNDFLEEEYANNYENLIMHFKNAPYLTDYKSALIRKGYVAGKDGN